MRNLIKDNLRHAGGFAYLNLATLLQILPLNLIVFPYISRHMNTNDFGEFLLLITVVNFLSTIISPPIIMTLYNRFSKIDVKRKPQFFGVLVMNILFLLSLAMLIKVKTMR